MPGEQKECLRSAHTPITITQKEDHLCMSWSSNKTYDCYITDKKNYIARLQEAEKKKEREHAGKKKVVVGNDIRHAVQGVGEGFSFSN